MTIHTVLIYLENYFLDEKSAKCYVNGIEIEDSNGVSKATYYATEKEEIKTADYYTYITEPLKKISPSFN